MIDPAMADHLFRCEVVDTYGETVGAIGSVWLADGTGQPLWASVQMGMLGLNESALPLHTAELHDVQIHVPFPKQQIAQAPGVDTTQPAMTDAEQAALTQHYGLAVTADYRDTGRGKGQDEGHDWPMSSGQLPDRQAQLDGSVDLRRGHALGSAYGRPMDDPVVTRSEEHFVVDTESVPTGRMRLVKYVVTERQQVTVEFTHEEVRLEREPIAGSDMTSGGWRGDDADIEREMILYAERPFVQTETVAVERVRLPQNTVVDE
ncbi:PRC and DUF2382 domain-containing protein [Amycolatopsis sp. NPDC051071]|uniref:PRC and DUF2382 domain-containing protein n=1 Tax=Amycolatopsis sp. NPDC051071 TaxID=3154637 RepID=UPI00343757E5